VISERVNGRGAGLGGAVWSLVGGASDRAGAQAEKSASAPSKPSIRGFMVNSQGDKFRYRTDGTVATTEARSYEIRESIWAVVALILL
jgi:hypothetical protein